MKTQVITGLIVLLLLCVTAKSLHLFYKEKQAKETAQRNIQALTQENEYFRTENGNLALKKLIIESSLAEIKADVYNIADELKKLKIKPASLSNYSSTGTETIYRFFTTIKDTVLNKIDTFKTFAYQDNYLRFYGNIHKDTLRADYLLKDTLIQVVFRGDRFTKTGKKRPSWWIFSKRRLQQIVAAKNPNTKITYSQFILVK
ncbi:MAG TPA: hypothetical protein DCS19_07415 [Flavobacterium sp.]|nr:hypothetical protein [Flavobacterium sp.]